jgi:hypothetical protein
MINFHLQYAEIMRIERFRTFVKHPSAVEKYMSNTNHNGMEFRDRWEVSSRAEGWDWMVFRDRWEVSSRAEGWDWMVFRDRWELSSRAEGWAQKQTKDNYCKMYCVCEMYIVCINWK